MNLVLLFRILLNNRYLIVAGGLIMGLTIYLLTRNEPKEYRSSTVIYTGIATGFNIESGANSRYDFFGTNAKFDNLLNLFKSRETQEEAICRLLAVHLIADETGQDRFDHLKELIPDSIRSELVDITSMENTVKRIRAFKEQGEDNVIYRLINSKNEFYGLKKVSSTTIKRIQNSDLIKLEYTTIHPRITQQTLEKLTEVFLEKYTGLQSGQTHTVVGYFEERVRESLDRLEQAEEDLLAFKKRHQIINYYEQTKFIADQKEKLDKDYQEQIMILASARAALAEYESRVSIKTSISLQSDKILDKRKRLSELSSKIAMAQVYDGGRSEQIEKWNEEAEMLKITLRNDVEKLDTYGKTTTGIPMREILEHWLENAVMVEEAQAVADVIEEQKNDFYEKYKTFAPIGSELAKIEREIEIAEKEYLNNLHSLNQSKLKQQNVEMSSNIRVLDPPFFPLEAEGSMTKILWVLGFIIGMGLVAGSVILLEFLDSTVKTPERLTEFTELPLLGVFPKIQKQSKSDVDFNFISNRLIEIMIQRIKLFTLEASNDVKKPFQINVVSSRNKEGKLYLTELLAQKLKASGNRVLLLKAYDDNEFTSKYRIISSQVFGKIRRKLEKLSSDKLFPGLKVDPDNKEKIQTIQSSDTIYYEVNNDFFDIANVKELIQYKDFQEGEYDYIFLVLPSLINKEFPARLVMDGDYSIVVTRANRVWTKADTQSLSLFKTTVRHQPNVILNGSRLDYLDSMIGEIPKYRSNRRKMAKRILTLDFWSQDTI